MKTKILGLKTKGESISEYACGDCFSVLEEEDEFCWSCGAELDTDDIAYDIKDLKIELKEKGEKLNFISELKKKERIK